MGARGCDGQADTLGSARELVPDAEDFVAELRDVLTNPGADLDDRLVELAFDLLPERRRARREKLGNVRAELPRLGIDDLEFLLYPHREPVRHTR
jgi:hypothetical protein